MNGGAAFAPCLGRAPRYGAGMIVETGHFSLILALLCALVQASLPALARRAAAAQFGLCLAAFLALMQAYVISDFSVTLSKSEIRISTETFHRPATGKRSPSTRHWP